MAKQWKKSLEQTDIVSDGEPFEGSYIDAPVSDIGGGTPIDEYTPEATVITDEDTAVVTVSGEGMYLGHQVHGLDGTGSNLGEVTVDGETFEFAGGEGIAGVAPAYFHSYFEVEVGFRTHWAVQYLLK